MTEQEYTDTGDLHAIRSIKTMLKDLGCFDEPNKTRLKIAYENLMLIEFDLNQRVKIND